MGRGRIKQTTTVDTVVFHILCVASFDDLFAGACIRRICLSAGQGSTQSIAAEDFSLRSSSCTKAGYRECGHDRTGRDQSSRRVLAFDFAENAEYDDHSVDFTSRDLFYFLVIGRGLIDRVPVDHYFYDHFGLCGTK